MAVTKSVYCSFFYRILMFYRNNANAALVFEFCYRFISIARAYFGKVDEESVKSARERYLERKRRRLEEAAAGGEGGQAEPQ